MVTFSHKVRMLWGQQAKMLKNHWFEALDNKVKLSLCQLGRIDKIRICFIYSECRN